MGTFKKGLMGGFSGKVGNLVGASWNGIDYMRSLPAKVKNPKTVKQRTQRAKFALVGRFMRTVAGVTALGFKDNTRVKNSAYSTAMSYNTHHAVKGEYPDFELDFRDVVISRGDLPPADRVKAERETGELNFTWETRALGKASEQDRAVLIAYNPARKRAIYDMDAGTRGGGSGSLGLPYAWDVDDVEVFAVFAAQDGTRVSDSVYVGRHEAVEG